jgi:hypothetical protein
MVTCPRPLRTRPTTALARSISRSIIPALSISSPARMKNGIDINGKALTELIMPEGSRFRSTSLMSRPAIADRPSENASGASSSPTPKKTSRMTRLMFTRSPRRRHSPVL